jgi:hypothetical protein
MKPGNDFGRAGLHLFAAVCELVCELLNYSSPLHVGSTLMRFN